MIIQCDSYLTIMQDGLFVKQVSFEVSFFPKTMMMMMMMMMMNWQDFASVKCPQQ